MSRIPRSQEHLKAGFTAEAVSAARFRAYAARAEEDGLPNLAAHWRRLAAGKDALAVAQLDAAGRVRGDATAVAAAISNERYENDVLYEKMIGEVDAGTADVLRSVVEAQRGHLAQLEEMRRDFQASRGDLEAPAA